MFSILKRLFTRTPKLLLSTSATSATETEFIAEVVRITGTRPHPNADKLEFVDFETINGPAAYQVISQKGQFARGDMAGYFGVDCIVPTAHPKFEFLTTRADGAGKAHYRLRAARLRGEFSQGLLITGHRTFTLGTSLADSHGITYYQAPEIGGIPAAPGQKANKPQPMPQYGIDSLKKLPRLFDPGEIVQITEKIHGTNFRFGWVRRRIFGIPFGWRFVVGSHRAMKGDGRKGWYGEDLWLDYAKDNDLARKTADYKGHVFFGELYGVTKTGKRIQDMTYGRKTPGLAVFDIHRGGKWLTPWERAFILGDIALDSPPILATSPYNPEGLTMRAEMPSALDKDTIREGLVIEAMSGARRKAKYVSQQYLMRKNA
jgi:RNA ligase (TIGR02306 family)